MRWNRWLDYIGGLVTVRIRGSYPERMINLALARGILLSRVRRDGQGLTVTLRTTGYKALRNIADDASYELDVVQQEGLPFYRQVLARRWMAAVGGVLFVLALYTLSSMVWYVGVSGAKRTPPERIQAVAARSGLHARVWKANVKKSAVEQQILQELPELSYAEVDIRGVGVTIRVVEKILPDDYVGLASHLVSNKSGQVEDVLVLEGEPLVQRDDPIKPGTILISGIVYAQPSPDGEIIPELSADGGIAEPPAPRLVRAQGVVRARIVYEGYGEQVLTERQYDLTGRKMERLTINSGILRFNLWRSHPPFRHFRQKNQIRRVSTPWGDLKLGWSVFEEVRVRKMDYSRQQALEKAKENAMRDLKRQITGAERIVDTRVTAIASPGDDIIRVKAIAEVIERVGQPQPLAAEELAESGPERHKSQ